MPYYRPLTYRGYYDYPDRPTYPVHHPYDSLFYGSRWYDYPPSLYGLDYTYRLPSITGVNRNWYRGPMEYGYRSHPYGYSPADPYGLTEPKYHMLFNDELKSLPKYSKYNKYPCMFFFSFCFFFFISQSTMIPA